MECGTARIEITPPFPAALFGYPGDDRTYTPHKDKVLDPLHARALYLQSGTTPGVLIVTLDLCILLNRDAEAFRRHLMSQVGLPRENIILACTHTHSAPLPRLVPENGNREPTGKFLSDPEGTSIRYGQWLLERLGKICALAISRKSPATLSCRETFTGLGYNRRCRTPEGIRHCWNLKEFPSRVPEPMQRLRHSVVRIDYTCKAGGVVLQNVGIHPVVMGKESTQLTGDWPHYARRHIEKRMHGYQAITTFGAGAQVQPWISTQDESRNLRLVGESIGSEAVLMATTADRIDVPEGRLNPREQAIPKTQQEAVTLEIGRLLLVALPFELSATWADHIITELKRPVIFLCLSNGWDGYWMSPEEFEEGGYEVDVALSKGVTPGKSLAILEMLRPYSA